MDRQACVDALADMLARLARAQSAARDPALAPRLALLQAWQARRLATSYSDQRDFPRRRAAVDFFLEEVYGAQDFAQRDAQFARAVQRMRTMMPLPALQALRDAVELQALTSELDLVLAGELAPASATIESRDYARAYRLAGRRQERNRQIALTLALGGRLQELTAHPAIELLLHLAAVPARLAGFGALQAFIERGYDAFRQLGPDAAAFLATIGEREEAFSRSMLVPGDPRFAEVRVGGAA